MMSNSRRIDNTHATPPGTFAMLAMPRPSPTPGYFAGGHQLIASLAKLGLISHSVLPSCQRLPSISTITTRLFYARHTLLDDTDSFTHVSFRQLQGCRLFASLSRPCDAHETYYALIDA